MVGVLAGLVNNHMADQGDFDAWLKASDGGRSLNLGDLDLVKKREHILDAAIRALSPAALQLLQTLALLQRGADYELLMALNPHLRREPEEPADPEKGFLWRFTGAKQRTKRKDAYKKAHADYLEALDIWHADPAAHTAGSARFNATIRDLERRGLLQYERGEKRYDLHPVVRGVAAGRMDKEERDARGDLVVSYFTSQSPDTWDHADSLDDLTPGIQLVATLTQIGRFEEACDAYQGSLGLALFSNCQAHVEILALLRPLFPEGWDGETVLLEDTSRSWLLNDVANSLDEFDPPQALRLRERKLRHNISLGHIGNLNASLSGLSASFPRSGKLAVLERILSIALDLANADGSNKFRFRSSFHLFIFNSMIGNVQEADRLWAALDPMGRDWSRPVYRPGEAETEYAFDRWRRGDLTETHLDAAETRARQGRNRKSVGQLAFLRGDYHLRRDELPQAVDSLTVAVRMAREVSQEDAQAEALLALARRRADEPFDASAEAERLDGAKGSAALYVAELWNELGETERAIAAARSTHEWAVADGEPYVFRYELDRSRALLEELGAELPEIPTYDPATDPTFDWEADVRKIIEERKAAKKAS